MKANKADCIRKAINISSQKDFFKFDKKSFDATKVRNNIRITSPKLFELMETIEKLDDNDYAKYGKKFKHIIYSDVRSSIAGIKLVASVFKAYGMENIYDSKFKISIPNRNDNFALLSSLALYEKPFPVKLQKEILKIYNKRPDNIYGENVRFLLIDSGFREGIDVFDVKYIHLVDDLLTPSDEKQAIGRGTRFCGQKGLNFHPELGWPLHVFKYKLIINPEKYGESDAFMLYIKESNIDLKKLYFSAELENICRFGAVDYEINKALHEFGNDKNDDLERKDIFKQYEKFQEFKIKDMYESLDKTNDEDFKLIKKAYYNFGGVNKQKGKKNENQVEKEETDLIAKIEKIKQKYYLPEIKRKEKELKQEEGRKIAEEIKKKIKEQYDNTDIPFVPIRDKLVKNKEVGKKMAEQMKRILEKQKDNQDGNDNKRKKGIFKKTKQHIDLTKVKTQGIILDKKLNFIQMRQYVRRYFNKLKVTNLVFKNNCEAPTDNNKNRLITLNNSQEFVSSFFNSHSCYKGILFWHSVGTGKTCSAVATASKTFENEDYTIIWVTRHTLKAGIWKNIFNEVCSETIKEKIRKGYDIPEEDVKAPLKYLDNRWVEPMSYKQFSNLIAKKNDFYAEMVKRNGKEDPLRKTLIIIDEAHKLFDDNVPPLEKPDIKAIKKALYHSYNYSQEDSCKLLLMTATPYTNDPMQLFKLLNLLREDDYFEEEFDKFKDKYLDPDTYKFKKDANKLFLDKISGYISYLNREKDVRNFAYPVIYVKEVNNSSNDDLSSPELNFYKLFLDDITDYMTINYKKGVDIINHLKELVKNPKKETEVIPQEEALDLCYSKGKKTTKAKGTVTGNNYDLIKTFVKDIKKDLKGLEAINKKEEKKLEKEKKMMAKLREKETKMKLKELEKQAKIKKDKKKKS